MNTGKFSAAAEEGAARTFAVLDFYAQCAFVTASSIGFSLGNAGRIAPRRSSDPAKSVKGGNIFSAFGGIEIHHPCEPDFEAQVRLWLSEYRAKKAADIIRAFFAMLEIPQDVTYQVCYGQLLRPRLGKRQRGGCNKQTGFKHLNDFTQHGRIPCFHPIPPFF